MFLFSIFGFTSLTQTNVFPTLNGELSNKENAVYTATFDFLWGKIRKITRAQNFTDSSLMEVDKNVADFELLKDSSFSSEIQVCNDRISAKATLKKQLHFEENFDADIATEKFNDGAYVSYFGFKSSDPNQKRNVILVDYVSPNNYILQIPTKDSLDEVYLAQIESGPTLESTCFLVNKRIETAERQSICGNDLIRIPYLKLDTTVIFSNLSNRNITNDVRLDSVSQTTFFALNENGITLNSTTSAVLSFADFEVQGHYNLILNKPFLLFIKKKNTNKPYLAIWVSNADLMKSYELQNRTLSDDEKKYVGTWNLLSLKNEDKVNAVENYNVTRVLKSDGTYEKTKRNQIVEIGSWRLNLEQKSLSFKPLKSKEIISENVILIEENLLKTQSEQVIYSWQKQ